jgi:hypothetical protein
MRFDSDRISPRFVLWLVWARWRLARIGGAMENPCFKITQYRIAQFAARRHLKRTITKRLDDQALVGVTRDDRWTAVAAVANSWLRVQSQVSLDDLRLPGVAFITVLYQDRSDTRFEKLEIRSIGLPGVYCCFDRSRGRGFLGRGVGIEGSRNAKYGEEH